MVLKNKDILNVQALVELLNKPGKLFNFEMKTTTNGKIYNVGLIGKNSWGVPIMFMMDQTKNIEPFTIKGMYRTKKYQSNTEFTDKGCIYADLGAAGSDNFTSLIEKLDKRLEAEFHEYQKSLKPGAKTVVTPWISIAQRVYSDEHKDVALQGKEMPNPHVRFLIDFGTWPAAAGRPERAKFACHVFGGAGKAAKHLPFNGTPDELCERAVAGSKVYHMMLRIDIIGLGGGKYKPHLTCDSMILKFGKMSSPTDVVFNTGTEDECVELDEPKAKLSEASSSQPVFNTDDDGEYDDIFDGDGQ